jgi:hypothetical protein
MLLNKYIFELQKKGENKFHLNIFFKKIIEVIQVLVPLLF